MRSWNQSRDLIDYGEKRNDGSGIHYRNKRMEKVRKNNRKKTNTSKRSLNQNNKILYYSTYSPIYIHFN